MATKDLDPDELKDRDDDLPVLTDDEGSDDVVSKTDASVLDDMEDHEEHLKGLLSDEELAALEGDDEDADEGDDDTAGGAAEDEAAAAQAEEPAPVAQQPEPAPAPASFELTPEEKARIETEHETAEEKALEDWRDGELTDDELKARMREIRTESEQKRQAAVEAKALEQEEAEWSKVVEVFHTDARDYIAQHPGLEAAETLAEFDRHVRAVTGNARFDGMSNAQKLAAAHRLLLAEAEILQIDVPKMQGGGKKKAEAKAEPEPAPKPKKAKPDVVPTLGRVPAAATNTASDGKWGNLATIMERGTPAEIEKAMAGLSEEEREAFASMDV